jgi:hypothetical protein
LLVIDVIDEKVEGVNALLEPLFNPVPLRSFYNAWNDVKREYFLGGRAVAVNVKRDPALQQQTLGGLLAKQELAVWQRLNPLFEQASAETGTAVGRNISSKNSAVS